MSDERLFDPGPEATPKRPPKALAAQVAHHRRGPVWSVTIGTVVEYVRAYDEESARDIWRYTRHRRSVLDIPDEDIRVRRLTHADIVALERIDPKLVKRLKNI